MTYEIVHRTKTEYVSKLIRMVNVYYHRPKFKNHKKSKNPVQNYWAQTLRVLFSSYLPHE